MDVLPTLDVDSIDACVTDPPYGIGFMGKEWDTFKVGAHAERRLPQWNGGEKQNPNLAGRSRSPAISPSQIEYDRGLEGQRGFQTWTERWAREVLRVLKPGAHLLVCGAPRSFHRLTSGLEDAGFEIRDCIMWVFGQGYPKSHNLNSFSNIETRQTFEGWGTALKPAWEPIIVARKPFDGSVADNVLRFGTGAINIDASRIAGGDVNPTVARRQGSVAHLSNRSAAESEKDGRIEDRRSPEAYRAARPGDSMGRWPANLIHDGSNEVVERFPAEAGAFAPVHKRNGDKHRGVYDAFAGNFDEAGSTFQGDSGSAARFFYCAKTSREDRNEGCESMDRKPLNWSSGTQSPGTFQAEGTDKTSQNNHPTVKPTALMRYLVRLVTPPGGTVLDPFGGSGSTAKACIYEGFDYVLIEREASYVEIIKARAAWAEQDHRDSTAQQSMVFA